MGGSFSHTDGIPTYRGIFYQSDDDIPTGSIGFGSEHCYNHPLQGSTTSDVLAIGYGVQEDPSFTKRDHGIFAQEIDGNSIFNNVGRHLGSFVVTHYHLLIFDYGHGWGSYFGIGGTFDPIYLSSYSTLGMFLSHPTLAPAPLDTVGSSTE